MLKVGIQMDMVQCDPIMLVELQKSAVEFVVGLHPQEVLLPMFPIDVPSPPSFIVEVTNKSHVSPIQQILVEAKPPEEPSPTPPPAQISFRPLDFLLSVPWVWVCCRMFCDTEVSRLVGEMYSSEIRQ